MGSALLHSMSTRFTLGIKINCILLQVVQKWSIEQLRKFEGSEESFTFVSSLVKSNLSFIDFVDNFNALILASHTKAAL